MAEAVADILGCDIGYATSLLEAAGGDPEMAINLGLMGGADGGGDAAMADTSNSFQAPYDHYSKIWPELTELKDSWKNQRLDAFTSDASTEIIQPLNGPCGVLAVVQAELWLQAPPTSTDQRDEALTKAVSNILSRILQAKKDSTEKVTLANGSTLSLQDAAKQIRTATALVEAAATTYGKDNLRANMSLVEGPHWLCSSDLMALLLKGTLEGGSNFGAFDAISKQKKSFYGNNNNKIGILSMMEIDEGIPVADDLKFDKDVYILHTGDHFVTMRKKKTNDDNQLLQYEIYDGLQPNGPVTKVYQITGDTSQAEKAPDQHVESFRKKRVGQSDDIVQAKKHDKSHYKDWTFEVVPAVDDPDVQGPWDDDPHEIVYDFTTLDTPTTNWRCATCYANRFKTMNFGTNEPGTTSCSVCNLPMRDAMWSLWLPFDKLSPRMQRRARVMYAPKLEMVLATLYPKAEIGIVKE